MKKFYISYLLIFNALITMHAQVGIGTNTPNPSSALDIVSTTQGMLIPTMLEGQRTVIAPAGTAEGLLVYQTDGASGFYYWDGSDWQTFGGGAGWALTGNGSISATNNFVGTTDDTDFVVRTTDTERMRVSTAAGSVVVGVGTATPTEELHIKGSSPVFRYEDNNEGLNKVLTSDANGDASWVDPATAFGGPDNDWAFLSGSGLADPIYHTGGVVIGRAGTTTHHLDVDNGVGTTTIGLGDVEYFEEGNNSVGVSHTFRLQSAAVSASLGIPTLKWQKAYANTVKVAYIPENIKSVQPITYGIKELMQLRPVSYNWKEEKVGALSVPNNEKELKLGLIAQEVLTVFPEVVKTHSWKLANEGDTEKYVYKKNNLMAMTYDSLLPVIVKAKQEQDQKLQELQALYNKLHKEALALTKKQ